jgi:hypothetical protein
MNPYKKFFLFCSGADMALMESYPEDQNKMASIGATVLLTGILAFITSSYALWTVFDAAWLSIPFGLIWGLIIFNLDRYIVMSMQSYGGKRKQLAIALPRLVLASLIAIVISNPLELKIFEKEIENQLLIEQEKIRSEQFAVLALPFETYIHKMDSTIELREGEVEDLKSKKDALHVLALEEADGTGGSGKPNLGPIYKAKKEEADKAEQEWLLKKEEDELLVADLREKRDSAEAAMTATLDALVIPPYNGYAARLQALGVLRSEKPSIAIASWFILFLFVTLECAPVLVKWLSRESAYDIALFERLEEKRHAHDMMQLERVQKLRNARAFTAETGAYRTQTAIETEKELIERNLKKKLGETLDEDRGWNSPILS